jgi:hypothetical protein
VVGESAGRHRGKRGNVQHRRLCGVSLTIRMIRGALPSGRTSPFALLSRPPYCQPGTMSYRAVQLPRAGSANGRHNTVRTHLPPASSAELTPHRDHAATPVRATAAVSSGVSGLGVREVTWARLSTRTRFGFATEPTERRDERGFSVIEALPNAKRWLVPMTIPLGGCRAVSAGQTPRYVSDRPAGKTAGDCRHRHTGPLGPRNALVAHHRLAKGSSRSSSGHVEQGPWNT